MTLTTLQLDYVNLSSDLKDYFGHLAADAAGYDPIDFFEKVPPELRNNSSLVEKFLNGDPELGVSDKDWSHTVSKQNGGSNSPDNGQFEDASVNRSRGAHNMDADEAIVIQSDNAQDASALVQDLNEGSNITLAGETVDAAGSLLEVGLDCIGPLAGGLWLASKIADHFEKPADKLGWGSIAAGAGVALIASPIGPVVIAGAVAARVGPKAYKFIRTQIKAIA